MRIASFNVENLFSRARVMNLEEWSDGKEILTYPCDRTRPGQIRSDRGALQMYTGDLRAQRI